MGISGFWQFFSILSDYELLKTRVKRGSKLLIDGDGFMFYTMKNLLATEPSIILYLLLLVYDNLPISDNNNDDNYKCITKVVKKIRHLKENKIHGYIDEKISLLNELKNIEDNNTIIDKLIKILNDIINEINIIKNRGGSGFDIIDIDMIKRLEESLKYKNKRDIFINKSIIIYNTKQQNKQIDRRYCGSYDEYRLIIIDELTLIKDTYGLDIIVYFDGKKNLSFKNEMKKEDENKIDIKHEDNWDYFYSVIENNLYVRDHSKLPLPTLTKQCLVSVLDELHIKHIWCKSEADLDLAKDCRTYKHQGIDCFVYSDDSDMVMMKNIPVLKFGRFSQGQSGETGSSDIFEFIVWQRAIISEFLGFQDESELVEFCILLGTDFTGIGKGFSRTDYDNVRDINDRVSVQEVKKCFNFIKSNGRKLTSSKQRLQFGIEYSRVFYGDDQDQDEQLSSVIKCYYERDENLDIRLKAADNDELINEVNEDYSSESDDDKDDDKDDHDDRNVRPYLDDDMFSKVRGFISEQKETFTSIFGNEDKKKVVKDLSLEIIRYIRMFHGDMLDEDIVKYGILREHLEGFHHMVDVLQSEELIKISSSSPPIVWKDVIAATLIQALFQKFSLEYTRITSDETITNAEITRLHYHYLSGMDLFDGRIFFDEMNKLRASNDNSNINDCSIEVNSSDIQQQKQITLPVYDFIAEIKLVTGNSKRVSIITGDTGSGKSTGVPMILMESDRKNKILITEPNREAVKSLFKHMTDITSSSGLRIAKRMGGTAHDSKDGPDDADITYATAGYFFAKFKSNLDAASTYSHIILDECHVRSIENDLVTLVIKNLLMTYPHIKVILMSATLDTSGFKNYFNLPKDGTELKVGSSPHRKTVYYLDDISLDCSQSSSVFTNDISLHTTSKDMNGNIGPKVFNEALLMMKEYCQSYEGSDRKYISDTFLKKQIDITEVIIVSCLKGIITSNDSSQSTRIRGILVFVSGISEIEAIENKLRFLKDTIIIEKIHRELEKESYDETIAYSGNENKLRLIIATNAAESSITISDVDLVIDFGCGKVEEYDSSKVSKSVLVKKFISKPSSNQRAGRTGRVRDGYVIRLFTKELFDSDAIFSPKNYSTIMNTPLHEVVIKTLGCSSDSSFGSNSVDHKLFGFNSIDELFRNLIDPINDIDKIRKSLEYLIDNSFIRPNDDGDILRCRLTRLGHFSSRVSISINLSRLVYYGIMLGVGNYALLIATILNIGDKPFRKPNVKYNAPDEYNDIIRDITNTFYEFDRCTYSEPICFLNLYIQMFKCTSDPEAFIDFCNKHAIDQKKFGNLRKSLDTLQRDTSEALKYCGFHDARLFAFSHLKHGPDYVSASDVEILKYLLLWCSDFNLISCDKDSIPSSLCAGNQRLVADIRAFRYPSLTESKVKQLFPDIVNANFISINRAVYKIDDSSGYYDEYFTRFITEDSRCKNIDAFWIFDYKNDTFFFAVKKRDESTHSFNFLKDKFSNDDEGKMLEGRTVKILDDGEIHHNWRCLCFDSPTLHDRSVALEYSILFNCNVEVFILKSLKVCVRTSNFLFPGLEAYYQDLGSYQKITFLNNDDSDIEKSIQDVPYGLKLLNAYCCRQRYNSVTVGTLDDTANHKNFIIPKDTLIKGYKSPTWSLVKRESLSDDVDELIEVTGKMFISSDKKSTEDDEDDCNSEYVMINKDSLYYHAVPRKDDDIYAIVSTVTNSKKEKGTHVQCDYVTILPNCKYWLRNALSCLSDTIKSQEESSSGELDDWEVVEETNESVISKIRTVIANRSLFNASERFLKSDTLRETLLKLHKKLTKTYIRDTNVAVSNNERVKNVKYTQVYIVSGLSINTESNLRKAEKKLMTEFDTYGDIDGKISFYRTLQTAFITMYLRTDSKGNLIKDNGEFTRVVTGTPIDLDGLAVNDKSIIVSELPSPNLDEEISAGQKTLIVDKLPYTKDGKILQDELNTLFSTFGEVHSVEFGENGFYKAFINFKNWVPMDMIRRSLSINKVIVGYNKLVEVQLKRNIRRDAYHQLESDVNVNTHRTVADIGIGMRRDVRGPLIPLGYQRKQKSRQKYSEKPIDLFLKEGSVVVESAVEVNDGTFSSEISKQEPHNDPAINDKGLYCHCGGICNSSECYCRQRGIVCVGNCDCSCSGSSRNVVKQYESALISNNDDDDDDSDSTPLTHMRGGMRTDVVVNDRSQYHMKEKVDTGRAVGFTKEGSVVKPTEVASNAFVQKRANTSGGGRGEVAVVDTSNTFKCFKCNGVGHMARDCKSFDASSSSSNASRPASKVSVEGSVKPSEPRSSSNAAVQKRANTSGGGRGEADTSNTFRCFKCNGVGHMARNCKASDASSSSSSSQTHRNSTSIECFKCKKKGHKAIDCKSK